MVNIRSGLSRHVEDVITAFMDDGGVNTLWQDPGERAWARPLVGFSSGDDPMWEALREVADPLHWTPAEAFAQAWPDMQPGPAELTVISWVLPQTEATRAENRSQTAFPSLRWARTRTFGEEINDRLKVHLVASLKELGVEAVAPTLLPNFSWQNSPRFGFSSTWSERHAAFISGLGTFGLCDGLITPLGKAMRAGSVIARMRVPATPRPYTTHTQYCLFHSSGACMKCAQRCPAGAITEQGHDKEKCFNYIFGLVIPYIKEHYGFDGYSCGLCQTGVPCEAGIPATKKE
ncbi:MAG TPA: epoxyqueuosine reductase [Deltaproteobacteria bacterium]|nr:epoxyqueuosine reductase [Deltaproteobacteria bacterium]HQI81671.1 epoxyqueuosine reductase [Deltaproteobacteria bacterium]